jgi:hypothetical protein
MSVHDALARPWVLVAFEIGGIGILPMRHLKGQNAPSTFQTLPLPGREGRETGP